MFLIQKKLESHLFYRAWTLVRTLAYLAMTGLFLRVAIPAAFNQDWETIKAFVMSAWPVAVPFFVFEIVAEKWFTWLYSPRPKKPKKGQKPEKVAPARKGPKPRVFYRRVTMSHLFPGRTNPVLVGMSEQDEEFRPWFRTYLAVRYAGLTFVGLVTILLIAAEPVPRQGIEGILGALAIYLAVKGAESFLLYLFLGRVMSGEDIHGARTTRFFAFEPTASFQKRLTLPIIDRKPWFVSLHSVVNGWYRFAWWLGRFGVVTVAVLMAQAAHKLKADLPAAITPALAVCLPVAVFYLGLVLERTMAYLIFFPKQKKKKKAKVEAVVPYQEVG